MQSIPYRKETLSHDGDKRTKETSLEVKHILKECSLCNLSRIAKKILSHMTEIKEQRKHP